ncbi:plancitoxin-1-like [Hydractinia symbiolongicarpus]|uniref:plancitoxin-1-like n=1 Tax=Hydractinia symbiolongicarpus TaxID=13093 RepID=UPI00254D55BD|nr:plancitoxin-1-like [Hydractinia symbiolongicarpus]
MFTVLVFLTCVIIAYTKLTCIGEGGQPVDMFIIYKLPRIDWYKTPPLVSSGHGYVYLDSNHFKFYLTNNSIAEQSSAAGLTLDQVYSKYNPEKWYKKNNFQYVDGPTDQAHLFYNDENPNGEKYFKCGHTKGALAFNEESGFWLINSVPKYPPAASEGYDYPHSGCMYGQMFMCVTFNSSAFNDIGLQLRFNDPHVHDANLPMDWEVNYPNIKLLLNGDIVNKPPLSNHLAIKSLAGVDYQHFAKADNFHKDLYHELVAPGLQTNILTETWQHGHNIGPSCDGGYTVNDIISLNISSPDVQDFSFLNLDDHSKFVVGESSEEPYVCVGDINRQPSQFKRGGGTLCLKNTKLWEEFSKFTINATHCGTKHIN